MSLATNRPAEASQAVVELYCRELKLPGLRATYPGIVRDAQAQAQSYPAFLAACLAQELQSRREHRLATRLRQAHFPAVKSLADFDFRALPQLPKPTVLALADGGFIKARENVICLGNPGTGKTHLAVGLAAAAELRPRDINVRCIDAMPHHNVGATTTGTSAAAASAAALHTPSHRIVSTPTIWS